MYIRDENRTDTSPTKELKVRIPIEQHLQLHGLKVMTGKLFSDTVAEALEAYFAILREADPRAARAYASVGVE